MCLAAGTGSIQHARLHPHRKDTISALGSPGGKKGGLGSLEMSSMNRPSTNDREISWNIYPLVIATVSTFAFVGVVGRHVIG